MNIVVHLEMQRIYEPPRRYSRNCYYRFEDQL